MNYYREIADRAALERAYSPSSRVANLEEILGRYATLSELARRQCPNFRTLQYGPDPEEAMDVFPAPGGKPAPAFVYIHGGYWQELSKREHSFPAPDANAAGLTYVAVNYGLAPKVTLDEMVERCRRALLAVHDRAPEIGVDRGAIHLAGCSAGAQLAAMVVLAAALAVDPSATPIRSLTLLSGVYDLRPLRLTYVNDALGLTAEAAMRNSPLLLVDAFQGDLPPTFLAMGDNETDEFKRQTASFADALRRKGTRTDFKLFRGRNHFDLIFDLFAPGSALRAATLRHLARSSDVRGAR